ncbi:DUF3043 domain-containing protein [Lipingzhangella sp. LS1_29]|uniref:DUF3043 domain-containing protein n=1 Tax=Lipingzhangella rawalii TaxID=2055835 RepID=A0ABU2H033_9ACTN|nr:DUF3043 domain-containing protein [Lipingzhangella rawalii]
MFRRRSAPTTGDSAPTGSPRGSEPTDAAPSRGHTPKKGAPTPKRKEAEAQLKRPLNAPLTRREAYRQYRERRKREAVREREGYLKGDERYFRPQDKGPVRAYARDYVDSRRTVSEFFLYFSLVIILLLFVAPVTVQNLVATVVWPLMMLTIIMEGIWTGRHIKKVATAHLPGEPVRGAGFYAAMRMLQIRRLRLPKPRLKPGDTPVPGQ